MKPSSNRFAVAITSFVIVLLLAGLVYLISLNNKVDSEDNANYAAMSSSTNLKRKISTCGAINKAGNYILTNDLLNSSSSACLSIVDTKNVNLDCNSHSILSSDERYAIYVKNVSNFSIKNCRVLSDSTDDKEQHMFRVEDSNKGRMANNEIGGTYATVSSSTDIYFGYNKFVTTLFQVYRSNSVYVSHNKFSANTKINTGAVVQFYEGNDNKLISNDIDGKSDGVNRSNLGQPNIGADDVVVLNSQRNMNVSDNVIRNSWECGIESLGTLFDSNISNNDISNVALAGICGWHYLSLRGNLFLNNKVNNSPSLFVYFRDYNLQDGESYMYFSDNRFESNTLNSQRTDGIISPNYSSSIQIYAPIGKGGGFRYPNFTDKEIIAQNNLFINNNFGINLQAPILTPASMIVDGGGNICGESLDLEYPLICKKN